METMPRPAAEEGGGGFLELALQLGSSLEPRTVMERILTTGLHLARADRATISSVDAAGITIEATVGQHSGGISWIGLNYTREQMLRWVPVPQMLATRTAVFGGAFNVNAPEVEDALRDVRHTAVVPILDGDDLVGMITLSRYSPPPFSEEDRPLLTAFAGLAGLALRNAHLYEQATARARRLHATIETAADVRDETDLGTVLSRLALHAAEAAAANAAAILRIEGEEAVVVAPPATTEVGARWPLGRAMQEVLASAGMLDLARSDLPLEGELAAIAGRYAQVLAVPLRLGGEMTGVLVAVRTHAKPFSEEDAEALQQFSSLAALMLTNAALVSRVQEAERSKSELIDIAVHELRSPLTVIAGYASLIEQGALGEISPDLAATIATIRRKGDEARDLADSVLTMARLESGRVALSPEAIAVAPLLDDVLNRAAAVVGMDGGTVERRVEGFPLIRADWTMSARILDILVGNALAYSEAPAQIRITAAATDGTVEIRVADEGDGIPEDERERIFDRFVRGSMAAERSRSGTGLGLYVSREAARRMGGELLLERSEVGKGSTFLLRLPAA